MDIVEALEANEGATCVVGAGGKKTTLYALATRLDRAVLTATVRIPIFDRQAARVLATPDPVAALAESTDDWPLGLVAEREGDRYRGYDPWTVAELIAAHDGPVLVKADGARTREFKAPDDDEPQLPANADRVVPVASALAVGEPLSERVVHRPERVAAIAGLEPGEAITPEAIGTVLAHPEGGLKGVPEGAAVVPLVNKVDDAAAEDDARAIAEAFHRRLDDLEEPPTVPRVVLARMREATVVDAV